MNEELFLQNLRDLRLEEGRDYIQEHILELSDHASIGNLLADEALRSLYTPFVSLKLAELLIFFGEYVHHVLSHALGLKAKGDVLCYIGHHQAALECLDASGQEFQLLEDECNWARSRISWILSCSYLGRVEEALQEAKRGREVFELHGEYYWVCVIDHNTAVIYEDVGRYQEALKLYQTMLEIYPTLTGQDEAFIKRSVALAEMNQALDLALLGCFEEAYRLHELARATYVALGEISLVVTSDINLGDLDYTQGYYGSALRRYYQARDALMQNNVDDPLLLADLKLWMANCLVKLNRTQEACHLAVEAVEIYRQSGSSLNTGNALREYATTLVASGRLKDALAILDEAKALFDHGGFEHYTFTTRLQQVELLLEMNAFRDEFKEARLIKEYFDERGLVTYAVRASLVMVGVLIEKARNAREDTERSNQGILLQEALLLCKKTALRAKQHNLQVEVYRCHTLLGRIFALEGNPERAARHFRAAIAQIERILHDLAFDLSPSFLHTTWVVYEDMIGLCLQQSQIERAFDFLDRARSVALRHYLKNQSTSEDNVGQPEDTPESRANSAAALGLQQELKRWQESYREYSVLLADLDSSVFPALDRELIVSELKRCETKISELFERIHLHQSGRLFTPQTKRRKKGVAKSVGIAQIRQQLSTGQLMLAYFLYRERLVIFAATKERLVVYENEDGAELLERLLFPLHAYLDPRGWPDLENPPQQPIRRVLTRLYELLVAPVAAMLPAPSGLLTIVPYGPLHSVPFHALHHGSHYLVENFQVNYLPASSLFSHLNTQLSKQDIRSTVTGSPLVFGYSENGHLQRVLDEARAVAALLRGNCWLESEATISRLSEKAPGSPIIHIATHGKIRRDAPNFSYVRLADGQLNAIDAFDLDLNRCELVTLSGCETGLSLSGGGDEQQGLGRAFLAAGAKSLVMSLWPVEDDSTSVLMQCFYQNLLKGSSRAEALRAAQCDLLLWMPSRYAHPYFWAAFRLVGEVGPLQYISANERSPIRGAEILK
jgi:tetratricopeptide (TPR) repeat protein